MSKLPNYCKIVFFIFRSVGEGEGWFEGDSTWLIHCKKPDSHQAVLLNSFKFCPPVVFIWLWLFFSCLRWRSFGWRGGEVRGERGSDITFFFPVIGFHFFTTIKLIYTLVYQPLNSYFLSVFWNMNLSQTVSNYIIGI